MSLAKLKTNVKLKCDGEHLQKTLILQHDIYFTLATHSFIHFISCEIAFGLDRKREYDYMGNNRDLDRNTQGQVPSSVQCINNIRLGMNVWLCFDSLWTLPSTFRIPKPNAFVCCIVICPNYMWPACNYCEFRQTGNIHVNLWKSTTVCGSLGIGPENKLYASITLCGSRIIHQKYFAVCTLLMG